MQGSNMEEMSGSDEVASSGNSLDPYPEVLGSNVDTGSLD